MVGERRRLYYAKRWSAPYHDCYPWFITTHAAYAAVIYSLDPWLRGSGLWSIGIPVQGCMQPWWPVCDSF